jgi:hypothetical protein
VMEETSRHRTQLAVYECRAAYAIHRIAVGMSPATPVRFLPIISSAS